MRFTDIHNEWHGLYISEFETAERELTDRRFLSGTAGAVCDVLSLPSHNHQTFFGRIVSEKGFFKLVYAKAIQNSIWFSEPIFMYTFEEAKRFEQHPMKHGRIVCRSALIDKGFVNRLLLTLWRLDENQPESAVVPSAEAEFTAIRFYDKGKSPRDICFTDASELKFRGNADTENAVEFLNSLHSAIESMIGIGEQ